MMPVHVEVEYFLLYQTLLFIADCWPIRIANHISADFVWSYVCFTVIYDTQKYFLMSISEDVYPHLSSAKNLSRVSYSVTPEVSVLIYNDITIIPHNIGNDNGDF